MCCDKERKKSCIPVSCVVIRRDVLQEKQYCISVSCVTKRREMVKEKRYCIPYHVALL